MTHSPTIVAQTAVPGTSGRLESLDQYRGYTVVAMLAVNFWGRFDAIPALLKHHNTYCSYADTIMPQFLFVVGFAYRLSFLRRIQRDGRSAAYRHAFTRNIGLILLGIVFYGLDGGVKSWSELRELGVLGFLTTAFQRDPFQALTHIGLTALWTLPVIAGSAGVRVGFALTSALLHLALSAWFYFEWALERPVIDGGALGFLTWTMPLLAGSLARDAMARVGSRGSIGLFLGIGGLLMIAAYLLSSVGAAGWAAPPFVAPAEGRVVDLWTMSQRTGSLTYLMFSTGWSLALLAGFIVACDLGSAKLAFFRTFGVNALAAYLLHPIVSTFIRPYAPNDSPFLYLAVISFIYMGINWLFIRQLERQKLFLRL